MTTPFDTRRLDEECERIAREARAREGWSEQPSEVRDVLLGNGAAFPVSYCRLVFDLCRRPKVVPA